MTKVFWRRRGAAIAIGGALLLATTVGGPATAVEPDDFVVDDASTLARLCAVSPDERYYVEAIHMCHGFVSGVAQYALLLFGATGGGSICLPDPPPSRAAAIADFVAWMEGQPDLAEVEAPEALVRFMEARYPCP